MKNLKTLVCVILILLLYSGRSFGDIHLKGGTYLRLRHEYWKNIFDMENDTKDNRNYFRTKASLWGKVNFNEDTHLFLKLTDEFKAYPYFYQSATGKKGYHFDINEMVFDNLYLDVKNLLDMPLDLRLGRQDFLSTYGEGFLIMDGTPYDGSRTFYFNAGKITWNIDEDKSLDFIYINDPRDDLYLPVINEDKSPQRLNITDEEAYVLYLKDKSIEDLYLEGYYIYKREDDDGGARLQGQKGKINTIGSFIKKDLSLYTLRGQFAYQFGDYGTNDRVGFGGYMFIDREFNDITWRPTSSIGAIYLSGDDDSTSKNEGWDPLFSRWPWMSELYSLSYNGESGLDYWTNLQMYRVELRLRPLKKVKVSFWYNFLRSNENPSGASFTTGSGKNRGHLPQARLDYSINKNINAYILGEYFIPGNFYGDDNDPALFLRTELTFKF